MLPGEGALFKSHIGPKLDAVLFTIIQHAAFLRRTVQQTEVILHGTYLEAGLTQDFIRSADFLDIVVGDTHFAHLALLEQRNQPRCPAFHIHRVVDPVHIDIFQSHAIQGCFGHLYHIVVVHLGHLRGKFGGNQHIFTFVGGSQMSEDPLRFSHAVGCSRIPEVQSGAHGGVKNRLQVILIGIAAEDCVSAKHACSPGPGSKRDFGFFHK